MKKKKKGNEKKNVGAEIGNGLLPKLCSDQGARQLGTGRWAQTRAARRAGAQAKARKGAGHGAQGRGAQASARGARQGSAVGARGTGAGRVAWACC